MHLVTFPVESISQAPQPAKKSMQETHVSLVPLLKILYPALHERQAVAEEHVRQLPIEQGTQLLLAVTG